jgi:hypothetical protein
MTLHIINPQKVDFDYNISLRDSSLNQSYFCKLLVINFDSTLLKQLRESPKFNNSQIVFQNENEFRKELANRSLNENERNVLLSIDRLDLAEFKKSVEYDFETYEYVAYYSFSYKIKIELRNVGSNQIYDTRTLSDTVTWDNSSFYKELVYNDLPTTPQAIIEIGRMAGESYAEKIAPFWTTEERMLFYSGNKFLRKGYNQFVANDLDGAIQTWKYLYEVGTPQLASIAAHNIGLVYEMQDDFDNSELWLNNSLKTKYHYQTENYLERIKERRAGRTNLDEEMQP